jgi:hypothetical protein
MCCSFGAENQYAALDSDYFCHETHATEFLARVAVSGAQKPETDISVHITYKVKIGRFYEELQLQHKVF